ncbi:LytR C-terminal domain-containing protein [Acetivibrio clariflavus]|uniref:LytR/CpsA/Psr regulator C-terminal domain-containing protein n=1 Tax=Acetivibrio clariflavus (strain DSM 19732 / NBRC 101661 / EBR45) TaxID=720554 RepID=G8LV08_ACECE|nr:LytR C-terminal domain-containing protein [Acetivibrio clariflavus]AEV69585.1 hypothetical protein Clocl_3054 [Acetivibrio clariflavus DSM 19732]
MAAKKKRRGRIRIKSFRRVILSTGLLTVAVIALLTIRNAVFSVDSKKVIAQPTATALIAKGDALVPEDDSKVNETKNEISEVASVANASLASSDEASREIGEAIVRNKGICVNVINHSQKTGLSEKVRAVLEVNGFTVSAGNDKSLKRVNSVIIEKKENVPGEEIGKLINIRRVRKEIDPDSRFDIVVILGDDY